VPPTADVYSADFATGRGDQHRGSIILVISSGAAKITDALSPIIPAGMIAGAPFSGALLL